MYPWFPDSVSCFINQMLSSFGSRPFWWYSKPHKPWAARPHRRKSQEVKAFSSLKLFLIRTLSFIYPPPPSVDWDKNTSSSYWTWQSKTEKMNATGRQFSLPQMSMLPSRAETCGSFSMGWGRAGWSPWSDPCPLQWPALSEDPSDENLWTRKNIHIKWLTCASSATDAPSTSSVLLNANNSMSFSLRLFSSATRCASVLGSNCLVEVGVG